ncbi:ketosteroid isomerase-like protein [Halomonas alkaliantarctica]|nr:ketosteroid isomerase-like protein [Halomonas alkaliantarctica]
MSLKEKQLKEATQSFVDANNRADIEEVMLFFSDDAIYEDIYDGRHVGKVAIREALMPFFDHTFGKVEYVGDDIFVDADAEKVMISWRCNVELEGKPAYLRGLDLLHFRGNELVAKLAYAKSSEPRFQERA